MEANSRYEGKPLLRLLECYVLWVIEELPEKDAATLREMTPKLRSVYRLEGDWQQIVVTVMQLPSDIPGAIRNIWLKNSEIAQRNGTLLTPQQFAEMFVDQNLMD